MTVTSRTNGALFTRPMKKTHTIFLTNMLHYHNALLQAAFEAGGYHLEIMTEDDNLYMDALPYISSDYCFPAVQIIGQMLRIVKGGHYPKDRIAFIEPQAGSACRSDQVYNLMIRALHNAGFDDIPVLSLNALGKEPQPGFRIGVKMLFPLLSAVLYGDLLMTLYQQVAPYEETPGEAKKCADKWIRILSAEISSGKNLDAASRKNHYQEVVHDFMQIPVAEKNLPKVGITGEIFSKFSPAGNMRLEQFLQEEQCAYRMIGFTSYMLFSIHSSMTEHELRKGNALKTIGYEYLLRYLERRQREMNTCIRNSNRFLPDPDFQDMIRLAEGIGGKSCITGDGWHVASEAAALLEDGYDAILITHPFGCLVSHVSERGIIRKLKERYPDKSIVSLEYDYGTTPALQKSRILMAIGKRCII